MINEIITTKKIEKICVKCKRVHTNDNKYCVTCWKASFNKPTRDCKTCGKLFYKTNFCQQHCEKCGRMRFLIMNRINKVKYTNPLVRQQNVVLKKLTTAQLKDLLCEYLGAEAGKKYLAEMMKREFGE